MAQAVSEFVVDFPALWVMPDWIEQHCIVPDGPHKGDPFEMYDWQLWCTVNQYRVKPNAVPAWTVKPDGTEVAPRSAFHYRRSLNVGPQKSGKGPWSAAKVCGEARGPAVFVGWAVGGEAFDCADHGCSCGWGYEYAPGEPMGWPWPTPLIQLLAMSIDQTDNIYKHVQSMIRNGQLGEQMRVGEGFIRTPNEGRIDLVTSAAQSRLGNPVTYAAQDEVGLYTVSNGMIGVAQTQRRNVAGMGGRSDGTTNAWDPAENSDAQQTFNSRRPDIFRFYREPPKGLSYANKAERRRIHACVYAGSKHVDLDSIEGDAAELIETDPAQAERFFGNRMVQGTGSWLPPGLWERAYAEPVAA